MLEFKDIDYILAVSEYKTISAAAEKLFISQPALSRYINGLEQRIGLNLFIRTGNSISLTDTGRLYVAYGKKIAHQRDILIKKLSDLSTMDRLSLKVSFMPYSGKVLLPETISILRKQHPNMRNIDISEAFCATIEQQLLDNLLDLGFSGTPPISDSLEYETIYSEYVLLAVSKNTKYSQMGVVMKGLPYPWIDIRQLEDADFVATAKGMQSRRVLDLVLQQGGISPRIAYTTNSSKTALDFVESGSGMTVTFDSSYHPELVKKKNIKLFCVGDPLLRRDVGFVYKSLDSLSIYAKDFMSIFKRLHANYYENLSHPE